MNRLEDLVSSLNMTDEIDIQERDHMVWTALQDMYVTPNENDLNPEFFEITEAIFGAEQEEDNVEGILKRLLHHGNEWALETHAKLMKMCPLSLKVTHELIRRGADRPVKECLEMEYRVACRMMSNPDFTEGVKHMIIDKVHYKLSIIMLKGFTYFEIVDPNSDVAGYRHFVSFTRSS